MTSSTWSSEPGLTLLGIGIDIEEIARFDGLDLAGHPLPFVFTPAELRQVRTSERPGEHLCIIFATKEALHKALGAPYDYTKCEVATSDQGASLSLGSLAAQHGIGATRVRVARSLNRNEEVIVEVYVLKRGESAS
ncbi:MAG: 4'-phosphopantetheinyl transferase superfamily protein [Myxococcota bacterium]|jgi:phosphopantetheine--protein transferase-like protein|nr:4'-phosphopantetheinyl transferase superfamily protein [Myxococcota bacterium]